MCPSHTQAGCGSQPCLTLTAVFLTGVHIPADGPHQSSCGGLGVRGALRACRAHRPCCGGRGVYTQACHGRRVGILTAARELAALCLQTRRQDLPVSVGEGLSPHSPRGTLGTRNVSERGLSCCTRTVALSRVLQGLWLGAPFLGAAPCQEGCGLLTSPPPAVGSLKAASDSSQPLPHTTGMSGQQCDL